MTRRELLGALAVAASGRGAETTAPFERIDTHTHIHRAAPLLLAALRDEKWRCLSICVSRASRDDESSVLEEMIRETAELHRASEGRVAWATAFDARGVERRDFQTRTVAGLQQSFERGAIAVKIWKNIGMGIRSRSGTYLLPDDAALAPVFEMIQGAGKTLIAHMAEPDGAWLPLDKNNPEVEYYSQHPEWHMYGRKDVPDKDTILLARDRMLAQHPKLRVVGCHVGSDEEHWTRLGNRLDKYPNFAVDVAARVEYFMRGDPAQARWFLTKYQDRVLYGTDFTLSSGSEAADTRHFDDQHARDWRFFSGTGALTYRGSQVDCLGLPETVVRKIFRENAVRWLPGITRT